MTEDKKKKNEGSVDVEELMKGIRSTVDRKIREGFYTAEEIGAVRRMELSLEERRDFGIDKDEHVSYLHGNWDPNGPAAITSHRPLLGKFLVPFKQLVRKLMKPISSLILLKQAEFNSHVTRLVTSYLPSIRDLEFRFEELLIKYYELIKQQQEMSRSFSELTGQVQSYRERLASLSRPTSMDAAGETPGVTIPSESGPPVPLSYLSFEDRHRGPSGEIKDKQRGYLRHFQGKGNVLDAGCGRGEFLELLSESEIEAYGVDSNPEMAALCREKGLKVVVEDVISHLSKLEDSSLGGIFAAQLAEHLTPRQLTDFVGLAHAKLERGASLVLETINPACLTTFAGPIYLDLTHTQPIHPEAMRFILEATGFSEVELEYKSPFPPDMKLRPVDLFHRLQRFGENFLNVVNDNFNQLNELLYGYQDYAVVATRK
jgi:O-antigen chain-terminating methyltransferase